MSLPYGAGLIQRLHTTSRAHSRSWYYCQSVSRHRTTHVRVRIKLLCNHTAVNGNAPGAIDTWRNSSGSSRRGGKPTERGRNGERSGAPFRGIVKEMSCQSDNVFRVSDPFIFSSFASLRMYGKGLGPAELLSVWSDLRLLCVQHTNSVRNA